MPTVADPIPREAHQPPFAAAGCATPPEEDSRVLPAIDIPAALTENQQLDTSDLPFCWMCKFHGNPVCDKAVLFVVDSISHIAFPHIIDQLHSHLLTTFPDDNITKKQLAIHIREHMLHPRIKLARMINRLSEMQASITSNIVSHDAESDQTIIDASAVKLYTVITNQIASLYKMDEDKLMFRNISMDK